MRAIAILVLVVAACGGDTPEEKARAKASADTRYESIVYAIVAANPEDGNAQLRWMGEQSNVNDDTLMRVLAELVKKGHLVLADRGVRAVPPKDWPK